MAKYKKGLGSAICITFLSIVAVICLVLDGWFLYINRFGKEQTVSTTVTISDMEVAKTNLLTGETITETKCFIEVNMYDNALEIKFNQLLDESQTAFYSMGLQLLVNEDSGKNFFSEDIFKGDYKKVLTTAIVEKDKQVFNKVIYFQDCEIYETTKNQVLTNKNYSYITLYENQSSDDYETPLGGSELLNGNESFKVQVKTNGNNEVFRLTFKEYDTKTDYLNAEKLDISKMTKIGDEKEKTREDSNLVRIKHYYDITNYYRAYDIYYLIEYIANSVRGIASGYIGESYIKMPDIFNVEKYNKDTGKYEKLGTNGDETVNLYAENCLYDKIKLTVHEGLMTSSDQSIFNKYGDYQNYNSDKEKINTTDYLTGRTLITVTLDDLTWETTDVSGSYIFGLSDEFKAKNEKYKKQAFLKVVIDKQKLADGNVSYAGFNNESLDDFVLYQIVETDGNVLYQGVKYA